MVRTASPSVLSDFPSFDQTALLPPSTRRRPDEKLQLAEAQPPVHAVLPGGGAALGGHERGAQGGRPLSGDDGQTAGLAADSEVRAGARGTCLTPETVSAVLKRLQDALSERAAIRPLTPACGYTVVLDDVILHREAPVVVPFLPERIPTFETFSYSLSSCLPRPRAQSVLHHSSLCSF